MYLEVSLVIEPSLSESNMSIDKFINQSQLWKMSHLRIIDYHFEIEEEIAIVSLDEDESRNIFFKLLDL